MLSDLEVNWIGLVDKPAIEKNFQAFKNHQQRAHFTIDNEKQIISGPAMLADIPLYRNDTTFGEYFVVFDKPSIQTIVEKFSAKGFMQKFNLFLDQQQKVSDVTIFNSFISDKSLDVEPLAGFKDSPDGSWFISAKVNNPDVWAKVKSGEIKGFSVEGLFSYSPGQPITMSKQDTLAALKKYLDYNDANLFFERIALGIKDIRNEKAREKIKKVVKNYSEGKEEQAMFEISKIVIYELLKN